MYLNGGVISYFLLFTGMKIYNTFWVYIIPSLFGGFYNVIIYNANFREIPVSLVESAKLDGASEYSIFFKIFMPLSKPVLSALAIFTAVGTWNDYFWPMVLTTTDAVRTLPVGLTMLRSVENGVYQHILMAGNVLLMAPIIFVYMIAQKQIIKGFTYMGVK